MGRKQAALCPLSCGSEAGTHPTREAGFLCYSSFIIFYLLPFIVQNLLL